MGGMSGVLCLGKDVDVEGIGWEDGRLQILVLAGLYRG